VDSPYWAKGPSAKSSEETGAETIYFISNNSFKTKPVITLTSFILSSLFSLLPSQELRPILGKGIVPDPCERDCSVYLILLPSLTIPLISLSLSTSAVAVATLHLDAAAAPVAATALFRLAPSRAHVLFWVSFYVSGCCLSLRLRGC